jgi:hypothetical protein
MVSKHTHDFKWVYYGVTRDRLYTSLRDQPLFYWQYGLSSYSNLICPAGWALKLHIVRYGPLKK